MRNFYIQTALLLTTQLIIIQSFCQEKNTNDFQENFNIAKQHLSYKRINKALPYLLYLNNEYPNNANLKYLVGLCYAELEIVNPRSIELLEEAKNKISINYNPNTLNEEKTPIYTHFYLSLAYVQNGKCEKAKEAFSDFKKIYPYDDEYYLSLAQQKLANCSESPPAKLDSLPSYPNFRPFKSENENLIKETLVKKDETESDTSKFAVDGNNFNQSQDSNSNQIELGSIYQWKDMTPTKVVSREVEYSTKTPLYGVQLGAFKEVIPVNRYKDVKNVDAFMDKEGLMRYVVGHFSFESQARSLLNLIKNKGYEDAFVVNVNNEKKFAETVISIDDFNIRSSIHDEVEFKIQLGAFKDEIPEDLAKIYFKIEGISEHKDGLLTYITVGSFNTYQEAKAYQEGIQATGIEDAFVIAVHRGKKVPLQTAIEH